MPQFIFEVSRHTPCRASILIASESFGDMSQQQLQDSEWRQKYGPFFEGVSSSADPYPYQSGLTPTSLNPPGTQDPTVVTTRERDQRRQLFGFTSDDLLRIGAIDFERKIPDTVTFPTPIIPWLDYDSSWGYGWPKFAPLTARPDIRDGTWDPTRIDVVKRITTPVLRLASKLIENIVNGPFVSK